VIKIVIHPPEGDERIENRTSLIEVWFQFLDTKGEGLGVIQSEVSLPLKFETTAAKFFSHVKDVIYKKHIGGLEY